MLLNVSYNDPKIKEQIEQEVGKPYTLKERLKLKGVGSPKLLITSTSIEIHNLLILDKYINTCNIELRPNGIIVRFRSLLETFALVIPYYKLSLYKGRSDEYSIFKDQYFIKIKAEPTNNQLNKFIKKITQKKADISSFNGDIYS
ncbi:hypothetical protein [Spongiivirga citrea]|uniref:Uncharacterized protein n=1 Tax=Spongiivirga citrea TaxID=1481457 RepID=A0A6M0CE84_9FLAO|nr:hypothetical protein [Spongiivirga citrea]NER16158.1 hypothetical protein [Spongiivirga citrea]